MAAPGPAPWLADAPLFQAWRDFVDSEVTPFTIPGHKRRAGVLDTDLGRLLDADVPLYGGVDTVKLAGGVLAEAEARAGRLWSADVCLFTTGGSTHANQVLCLTVGGPGDTVLVARNAHRSIVSGLALAGVRPVWLPVRTDPASGAPTGLETGVVAAALAAHPDAVGVFLTEPSYQGTLSDVPAIVSCAHDRGVPVVVDQAWGAHLGMAPGYPAHALQAGADALVTSAHKMLPAANQAALLLARSRRIDLDRLHRAFAATATTSPSASVLASIDAARALLASSHGHAALARTAALVAGARATLRAAGLTVPGPADRLPGRLDPAKLVVHLAASGADGLHVEQELLSRRLPVEMADRDTLVAQVGLTDDSATVGRLVEGILAGVPGDAGPPRRPAARAAAIPPAALTPREAFFADYDVLDRQAAVGRVSAELVAPYPPGIPLLVPGEVVTEATLGDVEAALAAGNRIAYAADPTLQTLQVVSGRTRGLGLWAGG